MSVSCENGTISWFNGTTTTLAREPTAVGDATSSASASVGAGGPESTLNPVLADTSSSEFWQEASLMSYKIGGPIILIVGTTGNILTVLVLRRMRSESSSFVLFFTALAISDLGLLYTALMPMWLDTQFGFNLYNVHQVCCKVGFWLFYSFGGLSAWLVSAMTVQRAVSVIWPHKVRAFFTTRQTYITITALVVTIAVVEANLFWGMEIHPEAGVCFFTDYYIENLLDVMLWLDLWLQSLLPFSVLLLSNSVLVWSVVRSLQRAKQDLAGSRGADQVTARKKKLSSMTITLMAVSAAFILLTSPIAAYSLVGHYMGKSSADYATRYPFLTFLAVLGNLLWYTNSSVNFLIYILTGSRFRQEFKAMMKSLGGKSSPAPAPDANARAVRRRGVGGNEQQKGDPGVRVPDAERGKEESFDTFSSSSAAVAPVVDCGVSTGSSWDGGGGGGSALSTDTTLQMPSSSLSSSSSSSFTFTASTTAAVLSEEF